ncbi:MAG: hypothetical protein AB8G11_07905 [Saprospiraceae bacterium]
MNRSKWTYISHQGEKSIITILHSPRVGHFAILMNRKIILLDKKVFGQDSYSFFIDDELCIVDIFVVNNNTYQYQFRVDTKAKTELNQTRKEKQKKNLLYSLTTFAGLFTAVGIAMAVIFMVQDTKLWESIRDNAVLSVAKIDIVELQKNRFHVFYTYRDSVRIVQGVVSSYKESNPVLDNGFPVQPDDAFLVTYSKKVKTSSKLHLNHPTHQTVQRYRQFASAKYLKNNPKAMPEYCNCILDIGYMTKGWEGYALLYNATTSSSDNKRFNTKTYQNWLNSKAFLDKEVDCWQYK